MSHDPVLRVVRGGTPDDAELAALTTALVLVSARSEEAAPARARWVDRARALRGPLPRGVGWAWADRR